MEAFVKEYRWFGGGGIVESVSCAADNVCVVSNSMPGKY